MTKIEWALELLNDGHWHSINTVRRSVDFSEFEINELVNFLSKYDLASLDAKGQKIKVNSNFRKLLVLTS
jgi:hypothetical protein